MKNLFFVDCEATGQAPCVGELTEFGAVSYPKRNTFHGVMKKGEESNVMVAFEEWITKECDANGFRPLFVSDNPAFDWQWINYWFHKTLGRNPFGHSARRISDFYAGLMGDFSNTQKWKKLRITPHDHNPVHDALGNLEAFERLLNGER